jgi:hypothetical protein
VKFPAAALRRSMVQPERPSMLQDAAVIPEPLAAVAFNEDGRRTQQGEQEQERAGQHEKGCAHAYGKAQSACWKGPRIRGAFVMR